MAATHAHATIAHARAIRGAAACARTVPVPDAHAIANEGLSGVTTR